MHFVRLFFLILIGLGLQEAHSLGGGAPGAPRAPSKAEIDLEEVKPHSPVQQRRRRARTNAGIRKKSETWAEFVRRVRERRGN